MHGLRTSSVLILDDSDEDALRIQKSLSSRGIGAILVSGAPDERRPSEPITGVRVAVLDINLGLLTDPGGQVRHTAGLVDTLIHPRNGPYIAVVWTSNPEDFDLFREKLEANRCPPVLTVKLDKNEVLEESDEAARADAILGAVGDALAKALPLEFSNLWEQIVRDAASDTVVALQLAAQPGSGESRSMAFLAALLKSEADSRALETDSGAQRALVAALNLVHFDKVEERSDSLSMNLEAAVAPIREVAGTSTSALELSERAELNATLLFDPRADGFGAGRIYLFDDVAALNLGPALPDVEEIRFSTVENNHLARASDFPVVFLEVSAECDHQQGNVSAARLIAGMAFAAARINHEQKAERVHPREGAYLRRIEPLRLPGIGCFPAEEVVLVWNARYPVSTSVEALSAVQPIGRLREPLVADVRAWLGYQAGRPGYVSV